MKRSTKEAITGYIFSAPILLTVIIFTFYPIIAVFYYSFTNYQPLEAQKFNNLVNPQEALEFNTGYFSDELNDVSLEELQQNFDILTFIELDVGVNLDEESKTSIKKYFDTQKLLKDFKNKKLNHETKVSTFMSEYMLKDSNKFKKYIPNFIGFKNFKKMFSDPYFTISLFNAILYALIVVPVQTILAVLLAVAANSKIKGVSFFKTTFFIPSITSSAAISMIFWLIYSKPGVLNRLLTSFFGWAGYQPVDWLNEPNTALFAIMIMNIWTTAGYFMITFLAGLQDISPSIYEAAKIDGAKDGKIFWKITMPMLKPQILFVMIMGTIGCLQVFDQIYFLIKNMRNITISYYIYKNAFEYGNMGYASALAVILFGIILLITFIQKKFFKEEY
ncbi:sugar ABC transporter permease [Oceanotoga sp. DSM 15011]|uniref:ABC-type sugar transport system permease subunit n=1 Tax=Oceanotoga teriensis TaxID=515440 RepID=A0AA45C577_9BACT|nr:MULTISPECIES: sugar ABC transporter permease [Oceanotoga]PWJ88253.1 ABC-type sugar transport system permease subunit [Oceanotoga teriensis]UYO99297.1 sugar ABC transporter permease [Oceanotoga sp. DSM 15011]